MKPRPFAPSPARAALAALLAASLLTEEPLELTNVPDLADVATMSGILSELGSDVERSEPGRLTIRSAMDIDPVAPWELVRKMRASFEVLGPLLAQPCPA